ncbi:hypothetical protein P4C99_07610 [Pontiellaceae bacterium B1224]|nr:hypothetical protein [Pontiellaceae bacterium B1224]
MKDSTKYCLTVTIGVLIFAGSYCLINRYDTVQGMVQRDNWTGKVMPMTGTKTEEIPLAEKAVNIARNRKWGFSEYGRQTTEEYAKTYLESKTGHIEIIGWQVSATDSQNYAVSYLYNLDGKTFGWHYTVNTTLETCRRRRALVPLARPLPEGFEPVDK